MTILGYDIDGQPLRAGDRAVIVCVHTPNFPLLLGQVITVGDDLGERTGQTIPGRFTFFRPEEHKWCGVCYQDVRKLPPKQADNETTTWESIEQLTGWVPEGVRV